MLHMRDVGRELDTLVTAGDSLLLRSKTFECFHLFCYKWSRSPQEGMGGRVLEHILFSWGW